MNNANTKAFTLWELMLALTLVSIGVFSLFRLLNHAHNTTQDIQQELIARNLVREGIEAVFAIRDSNRRRRSSQKDQCRIIQDSFANPQEDCALQPWLQPWTYRLHTKYNQGQEQYRAAQAVSGSLLQDNTAIDPSWAPFALCTDNSTDPDSPLIQWSACQSGQDPVPTRVGKMYRQLVVYSLVDKQANTAGGEAIQGCEYGNDTPENTKNIPICGWPEPKELFFCVRVLSVHRNTKLVQSCSSLTNHQE